MSHRYYSPLRPLSLGTFPKPQGNEILHIENFEERQNVPEIARQAWGYIEYKEALTEIEAAAYELIPSNCISEMEKHRGKEIKAMSEVYIRSQNKEKLYRLGGNYACVEYGEYEDIKKKRGGAEADKKRHVICISDGCLEEIGEYATKERCLEVLDEIQKACVSYLFTAGGAAVIRGGMDVQPFAAVIPRLYEMPEK